MQYRSFTLSSIVAQFTRNFGMLQGITVVHVKDHKQYDMFNPFEYLGPDR